MFNIWKIATFKGPIPDNCNAIWNNDVCQRSATPKCTIPDARYTIRKNKAMQRIAK